MIRITSSRIDLIVPRAGKICFWQCHLQLGEKPICQTMRAKLSAVNWCSTYELLKKSKGVLVYRGIEGERKAIQIQEASRW
ncbi:unnamed protein product, partial [Nesidiocoris tenuis]